MAFVKIQLGERNGYRQTYALYVSHGASKNKADKFSYVVDNMDCMITGHTHTPLTETLTKIVIDTKNNKVSIKQYKTIVATSWQAYVGYAAKAMMLPSSFVEQTITLHLDRKLVETNEK